MKRQTSYIFGIALFFSLWMSSVFAQTAAIQGHSFLGGVSATTQGLNSTNYLNGIIPSATITVYLTGTTTKATIYKDGNNTPLSNPFTSNTANSVNPGGYIFWAASNQGYDVVASGGISPNTYSTPITLCTDCFPSSQFVSPGVTKIIAGTNITISPTSGTGDVTINSTGGGGGCGSGCVLTAPTGTQTVTQPAGTYLNVNNFEGTFYADQYGTGSNGIETAATACAPQSPSGFAGCLIAVSQEYGNADLPQGFIPNGYLGGIDNLTTPQGAYVQDSRNGSEIDYVADPVNPNTRNANWLYGLMSQTESAGTRNYLNNGLGVPNQCALCVQYTAYDGGWDWLPPYPMPTPVNQDWRYGLQLFQYNFTNGIDFGIYQQMHHQGLGDSLLQWGQLNVSGGIMSSNSEGAEIADMAAVEDDTVYAGTTSAAAAVGATSISVNCTQGCATQGAHRLLIDETQATNGNNWTSSAGPFTTGSSSASAVMPPSVGDTTQNFPVSTMFQLCYPGLDNNAVQANITSWQISSNAAIIGTSSQTLTAGQQVYIEGMWGYLGSVLNGQLVTVLSTGLSSTQFEITFVHSDYGLQTSEGTINGGPIGCTAGQQPTGYLPPQGLSYSVTGYSISGNVITVTTSQQDLVAGQTTTLWKFPTSTFLNNVQLTVLSTGLSGTQFEANFTHANASATESGLGTLGQTGVSPAPTVTLDVVASYAGLPANFCTSSTLQSSNPAGSCYLPASGVMTVADGLEFETDAYTFNSTTQTVTLTNPLYPHLNGMIGSYGGLSSYAIEDLSSAYTGPGTFGTIDQVYPIVGSDTATHFYYWKARTNEQYGLPALGGSQDGGSCNGTTNHEIWSSTALCFDTTGSSFSASGTTITFQMATPAGSYGNFNVFNDLSGVAISTANSTYNNANAQIVWVSGNTFTYTVSATPSGTVPTTGTIQYWNTKYKVMPMANVTSVYDAASHAVDNTFRISPLETAFASGDSVVEPHFEAMHLSGRHDTVTQFLPEAYYGNGSETVTFAGVPSGFTPGFSVTNAGASNLYLRHGGSHPLPVWAYQAAGLWNYDFGVVNLPDGGIVQVGDCKPNYGCTSPSSGTGLMIMPQTGGSSGIACAPGVNCAPSFSYYPQYNLTHRGDGTHGGSWWFESTYQAGVEAASSVEDVNAGYYNAFYSVTSPNVATSNLSVTQLTAIPISTGTFGTTGSTTYPYYVVGHALDGGTTLPVIAPTILNGNATLSAANGNSICIPYTGGYSSYDILKGNTSTLLGSVSATAPNGGSLTPSGPPNSSCVYDTGQSTSAYTPPTVNTTGGASFGGPVSVYSLKQTDVSSAGCAQYDASGNLTSTGTPCGTGGGGMVYPGAGVPNSTGSAWGASYGVGTGANDLVQLNGSGQLPAVSAANLTNFPTLNQNTSGTAANLSGTPALPNGTTATTQTAGDNTTKLATDAFVLANAGSGTVTHTSGALTSEYVIIGNGSGDVKADTGCTTDGAGNETCATYTSNATSGAALTQTELAAPSGTASKDILWADSTAHRWMMNNNNGGSLTVAQLESPTFSGTPTAPTAVAGTNTTQLATTAFVQTRASQTSALGYTFGDAATGSALTTSEVGYITVPYACTITGWHIMADSGTATVKVARINGGTALPTISNSINTSGVSLSTGTKIDSTTVTDFTSTAIAKNDTLGFFLTAVSGAKQITFQLDCAH